MNRHPCSSDRLKSRQSLARGVLLVYPVAFVLGVSAIVTLTLTATDPTFFRAGLTSGFVLVGLSAAGLVVYPAIRADQVARSQVDRRSSRPYVALGVAPPIVLGILTEVGVFVVGGGLVPFGFTGGFVAVVVHPVTACAASLFYLVRRPRSAA